MLDVVFGGAVLERLELGKFTFMIKDLPARVVAANVRGLQYYYSDAFPKEFPVSYRQVAEQK